jgi:cytochrome P450
MLGGYDALSRDPYTPLLALRDRVGPVIRRADDGTVAGLPLPNVEMQDESNPIFIVLGYDAHLEIMRNPEVFHNGDGAYGLHEMAVGRIITLTDGKEHDGHRKLLLEAFGRPAVGRLHDELVDPIATWLAERMARRLKDGKPCCFARDMGVPLSYKVMTSLLGLPHDKFAHFVHLGAKLFNAATDLEGAMQASGELYSLYAEELEKRRRHPQDDLITWLANASIDGQGLTDDDIILHSRFFLPAGIETTSRSIALMGMAMLGERSRFEEVSAKLELIDAAVDECNRWAPSGFIVPRRAVTDTVVAGVEIPARSSTLHFQGIINRDPVRWPDPNRFDLHREVYPNFTFNVGIHLCMGMHLAKLEMASALRAVIEHIPDVRLACPIEEIVVEGLQIRSPRNVPLTV